MSLTVRQLIEDATGQLNGHVVSAYLDSQVLCSHLLQVDRSWLIGHADNQVDDETKANFNQLVQRRLNGEPVAYITGKQEFWSLPFKVTRHTLIPRPETEHLVEQVIQLNLSGKHTRLLDFGTGSGAIAIAIAKEKPRWAITAIDSSEAALRIARENAHNLKTDNIEFKHADSLGQLNDQRFDVIVSNPPYIASDDPHLQQGDVRFEPQQALVSGADGLDCIRDLIKDACHHLNDGSHLLIEHGYEQAESVRQLLRNNNFSDIHTIRDLAGHERLTMARWKRHE